MFDRVSKDVPSAGLLSSRLDPYSHRARKRMPVTVKLIP